jgi:outer membrane lipoprotein-sorting protein
MPILTAVFFLAMVPSGSPPSLTADEIVERMIQSDHDRLAGLAGYSGLRHYRFDNKNYGKHAEMTVRVSCGSDGVKRFEVVAESGSPFVRNHIIRKMIEAEAESSQKGERKESRIIPDNYDFRFVGTEVSDGRDSYVLEITPKKPTKFAICGRIWVDAEDFAIARIEGQPAKNPSFWIRSAQVEQRYGRTGQFWLPALNHSTAEARIFGSTEVVIEYSDYKTSVR